jgi:hypothetical protein
MVHPPFLIAARDLPPDDRVPQASAVEVGATELQHSAFFAVDWAVLVMTIPHIHDMLIAATASVVVFWCKVLRLQRKWTLRDVRFA